MTHPDLLTPKCAEAWEHLIASAFEPCERCGSAVGEACGDKDAQHRQDAFLSSIADHAPDLLAMLERLLANWADISDHRLQDWVDNPVANNGAVSAQDVIDARAAVAKARGDAP